MYVYTQTHTHREREREREKERERGREGWIEGGRGREGEREIIYLYIHTIYKVDISTRRAM